MKGCHHGNPMVVGNHVGHSFNSRINVCFFSRPGMVGILQSCREDHARFWLSSLVVVDFHDGANFFVSGGYWAPLLWSSPCFSDIGPRGTKFGPIIVDVLFFVFFWQRNLVKGLSHRQINIHTGPKL